MKDKIDNSKAIKKLLNQQGAQPQRAKKLSSLIAEHNHKQLNIYANPTLQMSLTQDEWKAVCSALDANASISSLYIVGIVIKDCCASIIAEILECNKHILMLKLAMSQVSDESFKCIVAPLKSNTTLETLDINSERLEAGGANELAASLQANTTLTELALEFCFKQSSKEPLAHLLKSIRSVSKLALAGNRFDDSDAKVISSFLTSNDTVTELFTSL